MYAIEDYIDLDVPDMPWVIQDFLPIGGQAVLYGVAKRGKSYLALQFAAAVAAEGKEVCGLGVLTHGPVMYLQLDTPRSLWHKRVKKMREAGTDFGNRAFIMGDRETPGLPYPFDIFRDWTWLANEVKKHQPVLVVIDTLRECFKGDENESGPMQAVFGLLHQACKPAAQLVLHHPKKPNETGAVDLMNDMRGSSYISGRVDGIMTITAAGTLMYQSRGSELAEVQGKRDEVGRWVLDTQDRIIMDAILAVCAIPCKSERDRARLLVERFPGMSEEKARSLLRRSGQEGVKVGDTKQLGA